MSGCGSLFEKVQWNREKLWCFCLLRVVESEKVEEQREKEGKKGIWYRGVCWVWEDPTSLHPLINSPAASVPRLKRALIFHEYGEGTVSFAILLASSFSTHRRHLIVVSWATHPASSSNTTCKSAKGLRGVLPTPSLSLSLFATCSRFP